MRSHQRQKQGGGAREIGIVLQREAVPGIATAYSA